MVEDYRWPVIPVAAEIDVVVGAIAEATAKMLDAGVVCSAAGLSVERCLRAKRSREGYSPVWLSTHCPKL